MGTRWKPALPGNHCPARTGRQMLPQRGDTGTGDAGRLREPAVSAGTPHLPQRVGSPAWQLPPHCRAGMKHRAAAGCPGARAAGEAKSQPAGSSEPAEAAESTHSSRPQHPAALAACSCAPGGELVPTRAPLQPRGRFWCRLTVKAQPPPSLLTHTAQVLSALTLLMLAEQGQAGAAVGPLGSTREGG